MILQLTTDARALSRLIEPYFRAEFFFEPSLKVGLHSHGQYVKVKLALRAEAGALVLDIKDLKVNGVSLGGNHFEQFVPAGQYGPLALNHYGGSLRLSWPGVNFRPSGVLNGLLSLTAEVDG